MSTTNDDRKQVSTSRRQFLKVSGQSAAASVLVAAAAQRVHAAEDNTIQLALVGCGGRGCGACRSVRSGAVRPGRLLGQGSPEARQTGPRNPHAGAMIGG